MSKFADRGMDMRPRVDLNMARFAEPPMIPRVGHNDQQRTIIKAVEGLPVSRAPKPAPKPPKPAKDICKYRGGRTPTDAAEVRKLFAGRALSTDTLQKLLGHKSPRYTTRLMRSLVSRGVVRAAGRNGTVKLWECT